MLNEGKLKLDTKKKNKNKKIILLCFFELKTIPLQGIWEMNGAISFQGGQSSVWLMFCTYTNQTVSWSLIVGLIDKIFQIGLTDI